MFLSTREKEGIYKFIVGACIKNAENLSREKLKLIIFKRKKLPKLNFLFYFFYIFFTGKIINKNRAKLKYENIEIIKFAISSTYYNLDSFTNKFLFYRLLIKKIMLAGSLINTCHYYFNNYKIKGIYIDHCSYINGVIYEYFSKKKIPIYTNNYPYGIYFVNYKKINSKYLQKYENTLKIRFIKKINNFQKFQAKKKNI